MTGYLLSYTVAQLLFGYFRYYLVIHGLMVGQLVGGSTGVGGFQRKSGWVVLDSGFTK